MTLKDIAQFHLLGVESLTKKQQKSILPHLQSAELQLRRELDRYGTDTFSYRQRQQTIAILRRSILHIESVLMSEMERSAEDFFYRGVQEANREVLGLNRDAPVVVPNVQIQRVAIEQNQFLINNAKESLKTYTAHARARISDSITQSKLQGKTGFVATHRLARYANLKIEKARLIFRTETQKILNSAKLITYGKFQKQNFPDLKKALFHPMDARTADDSKQLKALGPVVPLDKPFVFTYRRKLKSGPVRTTKRVFMTPPDRPNDRATIVPVRPSWNI